MNLPPSKQEWTMYLPLNLNKQEWLMYPPLNKPQKKGLENGVHETLRLRGSSLNACGGWYQCGDGVLVCLKSI